MISYNQISSTLGVIAFTITLVSCQGSTTEVKRAPVLQTHQGTSTSQNITEEIRITAPDYVENPNVVPVFVELNESVGAGDTLELLVNGKIAYRVIPKQGAQINYLSGRVRLVDGRLEARVLRDNKQIAYGS